MPSQPSCPAAKLPPSALPTKKNTPTTCVVIQPQLAKAAATKTRTAAAALDEAVGLAGAIDLNVVQQQVLRVLKPTPATLLGSGQVARLAEQIAAAQIQLCFINTSLQPMQQRNLEKALNCKVIDRTGLILEIFGARARTREGMLQVELAALSYQRSRLVRSWTHLERQRGGFGFLGGPGESQLELDRRMIETRIDKIKKELEDVRRTRGLQRRARTRRTQPVVALVGYTNAGKSTLFNTLTKANVLAKDMLFATLDPTMRQLLLGGGKSVMLSDTVGFIADLPTHLVESFRATLEEVSEADVILHVRDVAHDDADAQRTDVLDVLASMGIADDDSRIIEVQNKIDLLPKAQQKLLQQTLAQRRVNGEKILAISAAIGTGLPDLLALIRSVCFGETQNFTVKLAHGQGAALAWLYEHAEVYKRQDLATGIKLALVAAPAEMQSFSAKFGVVVKEL